MLSCDVVSHHPTPDIGSRCHWTPKHLSNPSVLTHLYTMPQLHHGLLSEIAHLRRSQTRYLDNVLVFAKLKAVTVPSQLMSRSGQPVITSTKVFDLTPDRGSSTRSW